MNKLLFATRRSESGAATALVKTISVQEFETELTALSHGLLNGLAANNKEMSSKSWMRASCKGVQFNTFIQRLSESDRSYIDNIRRYFDSIYIEDFSVANMTQRFADSLLDVNMIEISPITVMRFMWYCCRGGTGFTKVIRDQSFLYLVQLPLLTHKQLSLLQDQNKMYEQLSRTTASLLKRNRLQMTSRKLTKRKRVGYQTTPSASSKLSPTTSTADFNVRPPTPAPFTSISSHPVWTISNPTTIPSTIPEECSSTVEIPSMRAPLISPDSAAFASEFQMEFAHVSKILDELLMSDDSQEYTTKSTDAMDVSDDAPWNTNATNIEDIESLLVEKNSIQQNAENKENASGAEASCSTTDMTAMTTDFIRALQLCPVADAANIRKQAEEILLDTLKAKPQSENGVRKRCFCSKAVTTACICEETFYCSAKCQIEDWESHQVFCTFLKGQ